MLEGLAARTEGGDGWVEALKGKFIGNYIWFSHRMFYSSPSIA